LNFIIIVMISAHIGARLGKDAAENGVSSRENSKTG
jgi:hypothetical protein